MIDKIVQFYSESELLKADGFDEAVIGICPISERLIYSVRKCIDILSKDMDRDEAEEYFNFNVQGSYVGSKTPIWCDDNF